MPDPQLYPYVLQPKVCAAIWGGDALVTRYGKPGDPAAALGESWECWDANAVANGPFAGTSLAGLRAALGARLMGELDAAGIFPLLTKLIDARTPLSVQVHPDDAYARAVEKQPYGKTECWVVLDADPGAEIVLGWARATDRAEYERRVADGTLGELLRRVPARAGDVFFLPAGTLHAIGAGIRLFEAQQASDLTYRIFDWNRVDAHGKPRELHVAKAGDVLDWGACTFESQPPARDGDRTVYVADPRFLVERVEAGAIVPTDDRPLVAMALGAPATLACPGGEARLAPWSTAIVPAGAGSVVVADGPVLLATPFPAPEAERRASALLAASSRASRSSSTC